MRPGQTAPECSGLGWRISSRRICFNEAGADCPGMRIAPEYWRGDENTLQ